MTKNLSANQPNQFSLQGKVALVTAAGRGLGRAAVLALAQAGASVAIGLRDKNTANDLVDEVRSTGAEAEAYQMDMSDLQQIRSAVSMAEVRFGRIDILVNNAGIGTPAAAIDVTEHDFDETLRVNLKGTFFTSQAVAKGMIQRGFGRIINLSSQAGVVALQNESIYCMSKAAISHLTKCLALEWATNGINVNAVAPTFIETPGTRKWLDDAAFKHSVIDRIPLGRVGQPDDVTGAVVFLASPASTFITGTTLLVDGGWTLV